MDLFEFFQLRARPFVNVCDPDFYFEGYDHLEALNRLVFLINEGNMNFGLLTGEIGCGKTMTRQVLKRRLTPDRFVVVDLDNSNVEFNFLLYEVIRRLGGEALAAKVRSDSLYHLTRFYSHILQEKVLAQKLQLVIMLDEAQQLSDATLIELKNLTNLGGDQEGGLTVILVAQPELRLRIRQLPQIDQRISLRFHLNPLSVTEVKAYIATRLRKAGHASGDLFGAEAMEYLAGETRGIPREINRVCKLAMDLAFSRSERLVGLEAVRSVLQDLSRQKGMA